MAAQLALDQRWTVPQRSKEDRHPQAPLLCAACRAREARYGFRPRKDDPTLDRPRTLCFKCFRMEIMRRQDVALTGQSKLPLEHTLDALDLRRRRAQIAARHALDVGA